MDDIDVRGMLDLRGIRLRRGNGGAWFVHTSLDDRMGKFVEWSRRAAWNRMLWMLNVTA